jgi:hypothetical protein
MIVKPGTRYRPYIGLWLLETAPVSIKETPEFSYTDTERDGTGEAGRTIPQWFPGQCLSPTKRRWALKFEALPAADIIKLLRVQSWGDQDFNFCPFTPWIESFRAASGTLQRTSVLSAGIDSGELPDGAASLFAPGCFKNYGSTQETPTMGAVDAATGRQDWSGGHATLSEILYAPLYRVRLDSFLPEMDGHLTAVSLGLTEI